MLLHSTYFPNIANFVALTKAKTTVFEVCDNYQKQTYRNRAYIYGANGKLALNVPVNYTQKNRQLFKDVRIANDSKWQSIHWKSLESAYKTSPFFEYYEDELIHLFETPQKFVMDYNFKCLETILDCLQLELDYKTSTTYEKDITNDYRFLVNARKETIKHFEPYTQVFSNKHGFINNLSILDLLFNEGPNALTYIESQNITLLDNNV
jgi:hypothetical protein